MTRLLALLAVLCLHKKRYRVVPIGDGWYRVIHD